jgi:acetyl-CoA carboxylase biotin carboxyl carrier protein
MALPPQALAPAVHAAAPVPVIAPAVVDDKAHVVTSPFVGTFYRKPNPDSPVYVQLNDKVEKGGVLCIVEAMKLMNEIESDASGTIVGILVEDGAPVEYGQPLFKIAT